MQSSRASPHHYSYALNGSCKWTIFQVVKPGMGIFTTLLFSLALEDAQEAGHLEAAPEASFEAAPEAIGSIEAPEAPPEPAVDLRALPAGDVVRRAAQALGRDPDSVPRASSESAHREERIREVSYFASVC